MATTPVPTAAATAGASMDALIPGGKTWTPITAAAPQASSSPTGTATTMTATGSVSANVNALRVP